MRIHLVLATLLTATGAFAQVQGIQIHPGTTDFTSRGSIGNATTGGFLLQSLHTTHFEGVGDTGTVREFTSFNHILQDQNTDTQETYNVVFFSGTDAAGPNSAAAATVGPFTSPPRGTGGPIQAWGITHSLGTNVKLKPCEWTGFGLEFTPPPAPGWTMDGISSHMSRGELTFAQTRQFAQSGRPQMCWQLVPTLSPAVSHPSLERSMRYEPRTPAALLQFGNNATTSGGIYGQGGMHPNPGANFNVRIRVPAAYSGGTALMGINILSICPGVTLFPNTTRLHLPGILALVPIAVTGNQAVQLLGTTPGTLQNITLYAQAVIAATGQAPLLSSMAGVSL